MDSIAFRQQQRRHFEPPSRDWETVKRAILEAKGARECADVAAEEAERERAAQEAELWKGLANAADDYLPSFFVESTAHAAIRHDVERRFQNVFDLAGELVFGIKRPPEPTLVDVLWEDRER